MISKESIVKCPWCNSEDVLDNWDKETYAECISRELRRGFRSLTNESVWKKTSKNFYKCPNCGQWTRGNKLTLAKSDYKGTEKLGGEELFKYRSNTNNEEPK